MSKGYIKRRYWVARSGDTHWTVYDRQSEKTYRFLTRKKARSFARIMNEAEL